MSAIWRIADGGSIERLDGSFLHLRTHTFDPDETFDLQTRSRRLTDPDRSSGAVSRSLAQVSTLPWHLFESGHLSDNGSSRCRRYALRIPE
jgi:hypothetical protein